jgi:hypothetical protein
MPALTMRSDSAVTRYRMSGEPRRALQDTGTASVRNARQLSRAAVHMSVPRTAVHMSVPRTIVHMSVPPTPVYMNVPPTPRHMSVPRTAVKMSVPATPVKMSVSRTAAHMSATARVTTATIATIIAASTSSPSSERSTRRDGAGTERMSCHCMRSKSVRVFKTGRGANGNPAGIHVRRVTVGAGGSFREGAAEGITAKYCKLLHRADGCGYARRPALPSPAKAGGLKCGRLG